MNASDFYLELELISLENQAEIVEAYGELPGNKYLEILTFCGTVGLEICANWSNEEEKTNMRYLIAKLIFDKFSETFPNLKDKKHVINTYLQGRTMYFGRDIKSVLYHSSDFNFNYTRFHFLREGTKFGLPVEEIFENGPFEKYDPNEEFDQLMKSITLKTHHFLNSYFLNHVATI